MIATFFTFVAGSNSGCAQAIGLEPPPSQTGSLDAASETEPFAIGTSKDDSSADVTTFDVVQDSIAPSSSDTSNGDTSNGDVASNEVPDASTSETSSSETSTSNDIDASDSGCPVGQLACGTGCVDPMTDSANCGKCQNNCAATMIEGQVCVAGTCACPAGTQLCFGQQANYCNNPIRACF